MGRLPDQWAGRKITARTPYEFAAEVPLISAQVGQQYPEASFLHNVDKPFEIHRLKPFCVALDDNGDVLPALPAAFSQDDLQSLVRVAIADNGKNTKMTKSPTLLPLLVKGTAERTWEWAEPYTITRSEGFQVVLDATAFTNFANLVTLNVGWIFEGFLLVVAPASESR